MNAQMLVGDIGGTHCRLALASRTGNRVLLGDRITYHNADAGSLTEILSDFLQGRPKPPTACLAVAGPTDGRRVSFTNLDWQIDTEHLEHALGFSQVRLVNDFLAVGHALSALEAEDVACLQPGSMVSRSPCIAIGAGTGLGVVQRIWGASGYAPLASEGGHIAFAPVDDEQVSLLRFLQGEFGRVSVERILSGPGISDLYRFCRLASGRPIQRVRDPAEVTSAALAGTDPTATWAMKLFARIYGQTAGDLALVAQARGGVYLAGGIAPRILPFLQDEAFLLGFRQKGRFSEWMESVPVHVILDQDIGLKGAALALQ
jgi:glucokinase